jgi:peptide/nickel transport system substrate-binding protein
MGTWDKHLSAAMSRRELLARSAVAGGAAAASWALLSGPRGAAAQTVPTAFQEAPQLAEQVKAGTLPPLAERLPMAEDIMVVEPFEEIGTYGGTWRRAFTGVADFHAYGRCVYEEILRWPRDPSQPIGPGLAKAWEFSEDGKTLTLHLRRGLKWSDGEPFTVDDIIFWWEDIEQDTNLTPAVHAEWQVGGEPMTLEKVDDSTINLHFAAPTGLATRMLAFHGCQWPLNFERFGFFAPKHYLTQFHPKYTQSADYKTFNEKADDLNPERPAMTSWRVTSWKPGDNKIIASRNPYYWKVDPQGNQYPYIDEIRLDLVDNTDLINLKAANGELDMQFRGISIPNYPILQEKSKDGNYRIFRWPAAEGSSPSFYLNQTIADDNLRPLLRDKRFRQALSLAINRDRINQVSHRGLGTPRNATLVPESPYYLEEVEKLHAEQDVDKAKQLLDEVGIKAGSDGTRTYASGDSVTILVETSYTTGPLLDAAELVRQDWNALGLKVEIKTMDRALFWERATGNLVQIAIWGMDRGLEPFVDPIYQIPFDNRTWWGPDWGVWYHENGAKGEEPDGEVRQAQQLYDEYKSTVDPDKQIELGKQIVKLHGENLWQIGTVGMVPSIAVVKNNFRNIPEQAVTDWIFMSPGNLDPFQFFFKK